MIISASRRTDIPAFYSEWMMNRIRAGYCCVVNPFNSNQVSSVSLDPADVDVIVFWTRNAEPVLAHLRELDSRQYRYYFQYTITGYPGVLEPDVPAVQHAIETFIGLSRAIGSDRVIWRYDPIIFTDLTPPSYHVRRFAELADALEGHTKRVVISIADDYRAAHNRLLHLADYGVSSLSVDPGSSEFADMFVALEAEAERHHLVISSCAEEIDLTPYGISAGKCIDDEYIRAVFGIDVCHRKDDSQRALCGCVISKDIGYYDTCLHRCRYCYATRSDALASKRHSEHDATSPSIVGWHDCSRPASSHASGMQGRLF